MTFHKMSKPSLPQGTRDFGPDIVRKRNFIFSTIKNVFELYGYQPLETPAMENLDTLMGKYGEEGDKLIFKILNNGLDNADKEKQVRDDFEKVLKGKNTKGITERALKYDLTIPFARYVAMNQAQLTFPFKRYQIQPVWRADRPQKGRYREFYQCDADVVGSVSLLNEIELALIYHTVFTQLGIKDYELKINHRKLLTAIAELCGGAEKMNDIAIAIDKLDKTGLEKVKDELAQKGLNADQIGIVEKYLSVSGNNDEKLKQLNDLIGSTEPGKKGIEELQEICNNSSLSSINYHLDPTLARGLNYYTGIIFEAKAPAEVKIGSTGGGGRYDDLTGLFGVPNIPGVGISFGVDRIYDVMEELNLFAADIYISTQVLFFNLGTEESNAAFQLLQQLRNKGVRSELYHEAVKFDKQFKYAEKKNIPFVVIIGSKELETKTCSIKDLRTGTQQTISWDELTSNFSFNQ
jgi:histidyl-tRNA synthetase